MYIPKYFEITDKDEIYAFINKNAFGQLISNLGGRPFSTHMPFLVSEDKSSLIGHVAKQNPQHSELDGQEVLVTLDGPHDYISPSWYSAPGVPTWNYQSVHIYGHASVFTDTAQIKSVINSLTENYESTFDEPWLPEYRDSMLGAIIGVEISINEIQCKYKLSQNRSAKDQSQVIEQLRLRGSGDLAQAMERNEL